MATLRWSRWSRPAPACSSGSARRPSVGNARRSEYRLVTETNESFPSGHALASAAILGVVLVVLLPSIHRRATRIAVLAGVGLFALAIGLSRSTSGCTGPPT